eukprot:Anaeramoba_ignava/a607699_252.p3 GENE.a607699_252~~a607699_252.p3  ORF type:complete len:239 (+),score=48.70 a607699_252:972-1688(+)
MALLLYESKEMFSSTELIRKSKMIFDKIVNDEIEKAIILRDGKPGFMLMDFKKYEAIMADYEKLKESCDKSTKKRIKKKKNEDSPKILSKQEKMEAILNNLPNNIETQKELEEFTPSFKEEKETKPLGEQETKEEENVEKNEPEPVEEQEQQRESLNEEDEIRDALFKIKDMNFSPEEKAKVEAQIKEKIKRAREERAKEIHEHEELEKEELKEELQLQVQLKEEKKKKEQELKEFWD